MRKRSTYRQRPISSPILVERHAANDEIEIHERMLVQAFAEGWATTRHFDSLSNMRNVMLIAAHYKKDLPSIKVCEVLRIVLQNIRDSHSTTGRIEACGDDLVMINLFSDAYRDFWKRQNINLFNAACVEANNALAESREKSDGT